MEGPAKSPQGDASDWVTHLPHRLSLPFRTCPGRTHYGSFLFKFQKYWRIIYFLLFYSKKKKKKGGEDFFTVSFFIFTQDKSLGHVLIFTCI